MTITLTVHEWVWSMKNDSRTVSVVREVALLSQFTVSQLSNDVLLCVQTATKILPVLVAHSFVKNSYCLLSFIQFIKELEHL